MPENFIQSTCVSLWPILPALVLMLLVFKTLAESEKRRQKGELTAVPEDLKNLDPNHYRNFHDLHLRDPDGIGTIDVKHVVVSSFGIFVIETNDLSGWIWAAARQHNWMQQTCLRKRAFSNPLHQTELQVRALMAFLGLPEDRFRPVVLFTCNSSFRTKTPSNVIHRGLVDWIRNHTATIIGNTALEHVITHIELLQRSPATTSTTLLRSGVTGGAASSLRSITN